MTPAINNHLNQVLKHLYINPLEKCNLKCKICYTKKTNPILSPEAIIGFIDRYRAVQKVESITFCGGEVFALQYFPTLMNVLLGQGYFLQVITNGTIDTLELIHNSNNVDLIVSLDGLEPYHDANRGQGETSKKSCVYEKSPQLRFPSPCFFNCDSSKCQSAPTNFENYLEQELGFLPEVTYHPRKPPSYLLHHPVSNIVGEVNGFDFLSKEEMLEVMENRNVFPPKDLGCYQVALMSDGKVYGCCEGVTSIGTIDTNPVYLIEVLRKRVKQWSMNNTLKNCLGCSQAEFICGIKDYLEILNAN